MLKKYPVITDKDGYKVIIDIVALQRNLTKSPRL